MRGLVRRDRSLSSASHPRRKVRISGKTGKNATPVGLTGAAKASEMEQARPDSAVRRP
jgi:hypothetical protein